MIATLLARFGLPAWASEILLVLALCGAGWGALTWYGHDKFQAGVAQEKSQRDALDAKRDRGAREVLAKLNAQVMQAKQALAEAIGHVAELTQEVADEKLKSSKRESDLRAGVARERVLIRAIGTGAGAAPGQTADAGVAGVGAGSGTAVATLDGRVAGDLERVRLSRNTAIAAAKACVTQYDALKAAVDTAQK